MRSKSGEQNPSSLTPDFVYLAGANTTSQGLFLVELFSKTYNHSGTSFGKMLTSLLFNRLVKENLYRKTLKDSHFLEVLALELSVKSSTENGSEIQLMLSSWID